MNRQKWTMAILVVVLVSFVACKKGDNPLDGTPVPDNGSNYGVFDPKGARYTRAETPEVPGGEPSQIYGEGNQISFGCTAPVSAQSGGGSIQCTTGEPYKVLKGTKIQLGAMDWGFKDKNMYRTDGLTYNGQPAPGGSYTVH